MPETVPSRGQQLLKEWQGEMRSQDAADLLKLDEATFSRFRNAVRKPSAEVGFRIERLTDGRVPFKSWWEPPFAERRGAKSAAHHRSRRARAS